jgi:hypothetical protein
MQKPAPVCYRCELYFNIKSANQQKFAAAAALFSLTGELEFEQAANGFYNLIRKDQDFGGFIYLQKCATHGW